MAKLKWSRWFVAGFVGASVIVAGCGSSTARASEPSDAPVAPAAELEAKRLAELRAVEAHAAAAAAMDAAGAKVNAAAQEQERRLAEVHDRLARLRDGQRAFGFRAGRKLETEKGAYLGVTTSSVPPALREHLKLQRGFGLVVDSMEKDSPAAQAGLQRYDIMQKLNDQLLINTQQLGVLVRSFKPGDDVRVTYLRSGETKEVTVKLAEKDLPVWSGMEWNGDGRQFIVEAPLVDIQGAINGLTIEPDGESNAFKLFTDEDESTQSVFQDGAMTLTITEGDDEKTLKAESSDGQVLFEGPIASKEQREKLPGDVADKLAKFEEKLGKINISGGRGARIRIIEP